MHNLNENDLFEINTGIRRRPNGYKDDQVKKLENQLAPDSINNNQIKDNNNNINYNSSRSSSPAAINKVIMPTSIADLVAVSKQNANATDGANGKPVVFHDPTLKFVIEFMAGALGGAVSRTATAPIDRLRTVFQVKSVDSKELNLPKLWHILITEGKWQSLWRGNWVNVLKTAPENAIRLAIYEKLKHVLAEHKDLHFPGSSNSTFTDKFLCGGTAGLVATLVLYPLKTVKTLMNLGHTGEYLSINHCIRQTYLMHGLNGFYKGLMAHSAAIIPSAGIDLATYETLKKKYSKLMKKSEPNVAEKLVLGSFSSCIGNLVVYPLLFARTRLQSNVNPNETTMSVLAYVWGRDGLRGVYRGFLLHIGKIGPAASISYVTFETFTKFFSINSLNH